jgi:hypothetical protein
MLKRRKNGHALGSIRLDIFCYSNIYLRKIYQILIEKEVTKKRV